MVRAHTLYTPSTPLLGKNGPAGVRGGGLLRLLGCLVDWLGVWWVSSGWLGVF